MDFRIELFTLVSQITKWNLLNRRTPSARGRLNSCILICILSVSFLFFSPFLNYYLSVRLFVILSPLSFSCLFFNRIAFDEQMKTIYFHLWWFHFGINDRTYLISNYMYSNRNCQKNYQFDEKKKTCTKKKPTHNM